MNAKDYICHPTEASALAYWKTSTVQVPENMLIVSDSAFDESYLQTYDDDPYGKLMHDMRAIGADTLPPDMRFASCSVEEYAAHINSCYMQEGVSAEELLSYRHRPVYDADLWLCVYDTANRQIAATGIAELDKDIREGILDWIQISPAYRGKGLGKVLVNEMLRRMRSKADFVTVSGRLNNPTNPVKLYKACGFGHMHIWHVLTKKRTI